MKCADFMECLVILAIGSIVVLVGLTMRLRVKPGYIQMYKSMTRPRIKPV